MKKGKYSSSIITQEIFGEFKEKYPEHSEMLWSEFIALWDDIALTIREQSVYNPLGVKLGSYLGELKYQFLPHNFKGLDNHSTAQEGEEVFFLNIITRGKVAKLKWERRWAVKFNRMLQFFAFTPTRSLLNLTKEYTDKNPEKLRVSRNTLGGYSVWRQLK